MKAKKVVNFMKTVIICSAVVIAAISLRLSVFEPQIIGQIANNLI